MNYSNLEDAYGTAFQQRVPITHQRKDVKENTPLEPPQTMEEKAAASMKKNQSLIDSVTSSLPLDERPETENFTNISPMPMRKPNSYNLREKFTASPGVGSYGPVYTGDRETAEKINRMLRLIEQNKTGYETPAIQDMLLYIATGFLFLFTFDTFVMMGKQIGRRN